MAKFDISTSKDVITRYPERQRTARRKALRATPPNREALELAEDLSSRVYNRTAQVRRGFVARTNPDGPPPPMAEILRSGRGNSTRLKLYLSLIWIASGDPHRITASAPAWATLLDLEEPSGKGARQIRSGLKWLDQRELLSVRSKRGAGSTVTLRSDLGDGGRYSVPGQAVAKARDAGKTPAGSDQYLKLPPTFWTHGWIHMLSAPAVAMLLALLDARGGSDAERELWFSESVAEKRYTLVEETRAKGLAELTAFEIATSRKRAVKSDQLGSVRTRYVYSLNVDRLGEYPIESMEPQP